MDLDPASNVVDVSMRTPRNEIGAERITSIRGAAYRLK